MLVNYLWFISKNALQLFHVRTTVSNVKIYNLSLLFMPVQDYFGLNYIGKTGDIHYHLRNIIEDYIVSYENQVNKFWRKSKWYGILRTTYTVDTDVFGIFIWVNFICLCAHWNVYHKSLLFAQQKKVTCFPYWLTI